MKKILLPTDFSENSVNAIHYALHLFRNEECTFYLLNIYKIPYLADRDVAFMNQANAMADFEEGLRRTSKEKLDKLLSEIVQEKNPNHTFEAISDYNFLIDSVKYHIKDKDIDLIVMGTKGATGAKEIFMGSNTGDIIMKVDCNVLAVPENVGYHDPKEITFTTDYDIDYQTADLQYLLDILKMHQSNIRILHLQNKALTEAQIANKNNLTKILENEVHYTFHTLTNTDFSTAVNCFTQSRGNIDMIAIVARHYSFFQRLFFRPKVEELSFHTKIPLLVLHKM